MDWFGCYSWPLLAVRSNARRIPQIVLDYHVHTEFSVDCTAPMRDSCQAAVAAGITEIAFTDHIDHQPEDPGTGYYRAEHYFAALQQARDEFDGRLVILAGAEIDFHTDTQVDVKRFVDAFGDRYDFVIGSVHYGANGALIYPDYFERRAPDDVFKEYFEQVQAAVEMGWFDTIGHLDIPKRYLPGRLRHYDPMTYYQQLQPVFASLIRHDVAFEINTSGIRQAPKTSMPGPAIVRWYVEAGGKRITTGTDSHGPRTVGAGLRETLEMLRLCGMPTVLSFRDRVGNPVLIDDLLAARSSRV
ncbi:histidinol-phosphatase HisJ family protein [soil metagenome]